jgi:hypothetical protein
MSKSVHALVFPTGNIAVAGDPLTYRAAANCLFVDMNDAVLLDGQLTGWSGVVEIHTPTTTMTRTLTGYEMWVAAVEKWIAIHQGDPAEGGNWDGWLMEYEWELAGVTVA